MIFTLSRLAHRHSSKTPAQWVLRWTDEYSTSHRRVFDTWQEVEAHLFMLAVGMTPEKDD
jgi:hypothetical protein